MKFDFLIIGHTIEVTDCNNPLSNVIGNAIRAVGVAKELAILNLSVALVVDYRISLPTGLSHENITLIDRSRYKSVASSASLVLISTTKPSVLISEHGIDLLALSNCNLVLLSCFNDNAISRDGQDLYNIFKLITVNNYEQKLIIEQRGVVPKVLNLDFGVNELAQSLSHTEPGKIKALWVGCIRSREVLKKIVKFANVFSDVEVNIVSRLVFDKHTVSTAPGNKVFGTVINLLEESLSSPEALKKLSDWIGHELPLNINFLGAAESNYQEILLSHDIGLDFCESVYQQHDNTKILDYLSSGMFVFTENYAPSFRYVEEFDSGYCLPDFEENNLIYGLEHYKKCSSKYWRNNLIDLVYQKYGWKAQTRKLISALQTIDESKFS
ncbi:MAG: hypothetical protein NWQ54_00070 [Paraglaciecola sp.]|uniref:hypothetical protein n=1 Tax=Paraglaciecola sp. TaxID=1920173 RepID=UPI0027402EDE|nr:hypothetical protein [Paraglaciecola sp.]MDP5030355.1 hypothetical protein [Paraglaciecola sp.]MDP5129243.1 hypothetical protein [Paraglaciecola sp.]